MLFGGVGNDKEDAEFEHQQQRDLLAAYGEKFVSCQFSDGARYRFPAMLVAHYRAYRTAFNDHYYGNNPDFAGEYSYQLRCAYTHNEKLVEWLHTQFGWPSVAPFATRLSGETQTPIENYYKEFVNLEFEFGT